MKRVLTATMLALCLGSGSAAAQSANQPLANAPLYVQPLTPRDVREVQVRLHATGFYGGPVDGIWKAETQRALEQFQQSRGLQVTGQLNPASVAALGFDLNGFISEGIGTSQPASSAIQPSGPPPSLDPEVVRTLQDRLSRLGFYKTGIDGVWGPATQEAIQRFQQNRGLQASGQLNPATISALGLDPNNLTAPAAPAGGTAR